MTDGIKNGKDVHYLLKIWSHIEKNPEVNRRVVFAVSPVAELLLDRQMMSTAIVAGRLLVVLINGWLHGMVLHLHQSLQIEVTGIQYAEQGPCLPAPQANQY